MENSWLEILPFQHVFMSCHSLLAFKVSAGKSARSLMGFPLYVITCFSLAAFKILSLFLSFFMCLSVFLFGFILFGTLWVSWTWMSFSRLGKFSAIISSNNFSGPFSLSSPSGTPIMWMLFCLMLYQIFLKVSSLFFFFNALPCLLQYSQQPRYGNNPNAHQRMNG